MAAPKLTITKKRIQNHFQYYWWQYALLLVIAIFGWNLIYTTTRYRSPEHLKVEWYYEGATSEYTQQLADELLAEVTPLLFPDMEEVTFMLVGMDEQYGQMQLMVWSAAGQGDLYMLPEESFASLAGGMLCDLQPYIDNGTLNVDGIDLTDGYITDTETGERYLVGIPTDSLKGLLNYHIDPSGKMMGLLITGGNTDNTAKLMGYLLDNMR